MDGNNSLEEYFAEHPDEENGYYDDMAELFSDDIFEYPDEYEWEGEVVCR